MFENGCDTFAYVDESLAAAHSQVNPDDSRGTRHLDLVVNAMPAFFASMAGSSLQLFRALAEPDAPRTYEQIFAGIDENQVVLVTGEEDNVFAP